MWHKDIAMTSQYLHVDEDARHEKTEEKHRMG